MKTTSTRLNTEYITAPDSDNVYQVVDVKTFVPVHRLIRYLQQKQQVPPIVDVSTEEIPTPDKKDIV